MYQHQNENHVSPMGGNLNAEHCLSLAESGKFVPPECEYVLQKAIRSGTLVRKGSKNQESWSAADGHDIRKFYHKKNGIDNPQAAESETVDDMYLHTKSEAYQSKVRKLRTRMSVRGAKNVTGIDEKEVSNLRAEELKKRLSRRDELKKGGLY